MNEKDLQTKVAIMAFDLIFLNGVALLEEKFIDRRHMLRNDLDEIKGKFMFAKASDTSNFEDLEKFLD